MRWRERDHPRNPANGEFVGKDWASRLSDHIDSAG